MKIVINGTFGYFDLSDKAESEYVKRTGNGNILCDSVRGDPHLIAIVEEMGLAANGKFANLKIVEIPDDVKWEICESRGIEWVAEKHRTWR